MKNTNSADGCGWGDRFGFVLSGAVVSMYLVMALVDGSPTLTHDKARISEVILIEIELGASYYLEDFGSYPIYPPSSRNHGARNTEGLKGSCLLYKELSGDFDLDGKLYEANGDRDEGDENRFVYVRTYLWNQEMKGRGVPVIKNPAGPGYVFVDGYKKPLRYLAERSNGTAEKLTHNPTFDLW